MKKKISFCFVFVLMLAVLCSACGNNRTEENAEKPAVNQEAVKYENGIILLKTNEKYDMTDMDQSSGDNEKDTKDINFGPGDINFAD